MSDLSVRVAVAGAKPNASRKATDEQIRQAYEATNNVWRAAKLLGMCGQSVHERLVKLGVKRRYPKWSETDKITLVEQYDDHASSGRLDELAERMGRTRQFICRQAGLLGLTDKARGRPYNDATHLAAWTRENGHPRGMLGKHHTWTAAQIEVMVDKRQATSMQRYGRISMGTGYGSPWKAGWREISGRRNYYRSSWEANYGRYLQWLKEQGEIEEWQHEPETFRFPGARMKGSPWSYLPDFKVVEVSGDASYHEVKGWMDDRSKSKIAFMTKFYPEVRMVLVDKDRYWSIARSMRFLIPGWERRT